MASDKTRKAVIFAIIFASIAISAIVWTKAREARRHKVTLQAGLSAPDFTVAYRDSRPVPLSELYNSRLTVVAFTDQAESSERLAALMEKKLATLTKRVHGLVWLDVMRQGASSVIEEKTGSVPILFRMNYDKIPKFYYSRILPAIIVIDTGGTIRTVYRGYSPTVFEDLLAVITGAAE